MSFKILVVDDSKAVHAFIKDCFSSTPHQLMHVFNGSECLKVLSEKRTFDLILMDWEMPELTGPETVVEIKRGGIEIPIIMMTTRNAMEDIQKMLEAGVSEYTMKPFTKVILFEKIESVLGSVVSNAA